jgi:hypothetical protein
VADDARVVDPIAALWHAHGSTNEKLGLLKGEVAGMASRSDLYEFKEAVFARMEVIVGKALEEHDRRHADKYAIRLHEDRAAMVLAIKEEFDRRDAERAKALEDAAKEHERARGLTMRQTGLAILISLAAGALFSEFVGPAVFKFGLQKFMGL